MVRPVASRSRWLSSVYYAFFSSGFHREHNSFLSGTIEYEKALRTPSVGFALLRRNTHRLEKGLLMRPRRNIFAKDYIEETVDCYAKVVHGIEPQSEQCVCEELYWVHDVLKEFFAATVRDKVLDKARAVFASTRPLPIRQTQLVPYHRNLKDRPDISIDSFHELSRLRRSVRWFLEKPVERELIDRAVEIAAQAPSACNRQPFQFRIFDDPALVKKVVKMPMGTAGYADNIPVMLVIIGQQRNYFSERDRHLIYIDSSLAAMSMIFALEIQGLSTCCINWPDIESRENAIAELLGLAPDERPVMCMAIGYPDPEGMVAYSQKKPLAQLRTYNFENQ
jgi:nitroreductase